MVVQALLRIFGRFPKFFIAIAKRCSTTILHLLRYLFSCRNASVQKSMETGTRKGLASTASSTDSVTRVMQLEENGGIKPATTLCSEVGGVSGGSVLHHTQVIPRSAAKHQTSFESSTPATIAPPEVGDASGQAIPLNTVSDDVELRPHNVLPQACAQREPHPLKYSLQLLAIFILALETISTCFFLNGSLSILRSVRDMQDGRQTDIAKFNTFWGEFRRRLQNVTLLASLTEQERGPFGKY